MSLLTRITAGTATLALVVAGPGASRLAARADDEPAHRPGVAVTFTLRLLPDGSASGTFTAAGAASDSGSAAASPHVAALDATTGRLTGDLTLHGSGGTLRWTFRGLTYPLNAPRAIGAGRAELVSATGDYAGLEGGARFVTTADFTTSTVTGSLLGSVRLADQDH